MFLGLLHGKSFHFYRPTKKKVAFLFFSMMVNCKICLGSIVFLVTQIVPFLHTEREEFGVHTYRDCDLGEPLAGSCSGSGKLGLWSQKICHICRNFTFFILFYWFCFREMQQSSQMLNGGTPSVPLTNITTEQIQMVLLHCL